MGVVPIWRSFVALVHAFLKAKEGAIHRLESSHFPFDKKLPCQITDLAVKSKYHKENQKGKQLVQ